MAVISSANDTFYISTKQQYFEDNYYEDLDLRVSGLKESINFKSKKVKMSGTTITLNNYEINGKRFTDRAKYGLANATVEIYLKTGSCESLEDCAKLATLKVTRFDQDKEKVTIKCEEYLTQSLNTELPKKEYTLYSEDNEGATLNGKTYEVYNEERIPILYGHLKEAPAITYIDNETNATRVFPDNAYISNYDIVGIKRMDFQQYTHDLANAITTQVIDQDVLTAKLGDGGARVLKLMPRQANDRILRKPFDKQFDIYNNYIEFFEDVDSSNNNPSQYLNQGALLVSELSKLEKVNSYYNFYAHDEQAGQDSDTGLPNEHHHFGRYTFDNDINPSDFSDSDLFTNVSAKWGNIENSSNDYLQTVRGARSPRNHYEEADDGHRERIVDNPCIEFQFEEMKSSPDVFTDVKGIEAPSDFNIITFINTKTEFTGTSIGFQGDARMAMCFFSTKSNQTYNISVAYDSEDIDIGNAFQSDNPVGFVPEVLNGITITDEDGDETFKEGLINTFGVHECAKRPRVIAPMRLEIENDFVNAAQRLDDHRNPFNNPVNEGSDEEINQFRNRGDFISSYPMHDARSVLINFVPFDLEEGANIYIDLDFFAEFKGMLMRRLWYQKDALNNKMFLNAKGRHSGVYDDNRVYDINSMKLAYFSPNPRCPNSGTEILPSDDLLFRYLLDYIGNDKLRFIEVDGLKAEIMIKVDFTNISDNTEVVNADMQNEIGYIFDLDINQITTEFTNTAMHAIYINGTYFRKESDFFNENSFFNSNINSLGEDGNVIVPKVELWYCTKEVDANGNILDIKETTIEVEEFNSEINSEPLEEKVTLWFDPYDTDFEGAKKIIKTPKVIVKDLMNREFGQGDFVTKNTADSNYELNFSIDKPQKTVDVLQQVAQNTNFFYKTGLSNSLPTVIGMKNSYAGDDVDKTILVDYIESYNFSKTNIEDLAVKCRVKYGYDYITESFKHVTEEIQVPNTEDYKAYYGLSDNDISGDEFLLEHEAPYIQDEPTAILLRNHLHELHKNQHTIVDFKINLSQGFELEVGDIINFKAIGDGDYKSFFSPYGVDIMQPTGLPFLPNISPGNQQFVLPYFMITDINKTMDSVSIKAIQIHELIGLTQIPEPPIDDDEDDTGDDDTGDDDTGDDDTEEDLIQTPGDLTLNGTGFESADYDLLLFAVNNPVGANLNEQQILNGDINNYPLEGDGNIDALDLVAFMDYYIETMGDSYLPGDVTGDGYVTQDDVDAAQAYVDDPVANPLSLNAIANGDIAEPRDGMITAEDVAAIDAIKKVPPAEVTPIGDLLIDTSVNEFLGVLAMYHSGDNIVVEIAQAHTINEMLDLNDYLEELSANNLTLVGTNITFQPTLTGDLISPQYYPWLNAAGYYTIESIVHISDVAPQLKRFIITLDAPEIDGSNLIGVGAYPDYVGEINDVNVKIYGTPETSDDADDDGYAELLSTRHHYAASGLDADIGGWQYQTGLQLNITTSNPILTGADNTIVPNATLAELRDAFPDVFQFTSGIYCKVNLSYHQEYEDYNGAPTSSNMVKINNWLAFDGFFVRISAGTDTFFRLNYQYMLYPNGEPVVYENGEIDLYQDGNLIEINHTNFNLNPAEDYIILTLSYPVESNE
tara:strand:- start:5656 stop:10509 length:4854 start_codon:yes stop_codon:yes gene_type:complete